MFKIGKRGFLTFIARLFQLENYVAIPRFFYVHKKPLRSIFNEVFSLGKYPQKLYFNSPIGTYKVNLYSPNDFSTFNLIFCRKDYFFNNNYKIVLDIGSNLSVDVQMPPA